MATEPLIPGVNRDGRCEDYNNDPAKSYHAHDLPRCERTGVAWFEGRWLCKEHADRRRGR